MPEELNYPIGHDIITKYEEELIASLPQLYPNEGERKIVETVLLKEFRLKLCEVFEEFLEKRSKGPGGREKEIPVSSHEIPELCSKIDEMITKNRQLLAADTLFKSALAKIQQYRPQVQEELSERGMQSFREALAAHGITDRQSLIAKSVGWFASKNAKFPTHGGGGGGGKAFRGGKAFIGAILGRGVYNMTLETLGEVADKLGFEKLTEHEERQKKLEILTSHGITDRQSLLTKKVSWFTSKEADFHPYGKGKTFIGKILSKPIDNVSLEILEEVADKLGFEKSNEQDEKQGFIDAFATHGITDRQSLLAKGSNWFKSKNAKFPSYGGGKAFSGGKAFIGKILGKNIRDVNLETLNEVVDILNLPELSKQSKQGFIDALATHGMTDRQSLLAKGTKWFQSTDAKFPPYRGGGRKFVGTILGKVNPALKNETLKEVADILFPESEEQSKQGFIDALATHGMTDRQSLLAKGTKWFKSTDAKFPNYGGGGRKFVGTILDRAKPPMTLETLEEVAGKLGFERCDELGFEKLTGQDEKQRQLERLASHGITDRQSLLEKGVEWLKSSKAIFPHYGKGKKFFKAILGRRIENINLKILEEVADILFEEQEGAEFFDSTIVSNIQEQLIKDISKLYPKKSDRTIVREIILPQLILELDSAFKQVSKQNHGKLSSSVSVNQIPELYTTIDELIDKNSSLLSAQGIGKPLLDRLQILRQEAKKKLELDYNRYLNPEEESTNK